MKQLGAHILTLGWGVEKEMQNLGDGIELGYHFPEWGAPVLYLPLLQLTAYYRSMAKGLNPDKPTNLDAVVRLTTI
jgi:glucosamine--fructose-6-phosphate aminotransferase (isomerizing)